MSRASEKPSANVTAQIGDSIPPPRSPSVQPFELAADESSHESVMVYATLTGVAAALPVPVASDWLAGLVRGAAFRRVAQRHGVGLSVEARSVLASPAASSKAVGAAKIAGFVFSQLTNPVRMFTRVDDAVAAALSAVLFDHYLRARRDVDGVIGASEARRVRAALDVALSRTSGRNLLSLPKSIAGVAQRSWRTVRDGDLEGRSTAERFLDTWLDAMADAPESVVDSARRAFDEALGDGA